LTLLNGIGYVVQGREQSTVEDILEVFNETGVMHLPVMETTESNEQRLRGLLSFAKVKRLLVEVT
jgi:CBS domain-containing protein